jgi:hypothetical protein
VGIILESAADSNPGNNVSSALPVQVVSSREPFDIGVRMTDVSPRQVASGGALAVRYTVENSARVSGIYVREVRLSQDAMITADDTLISSRTFALLGDEPEFESTNNVIPAATAPGNYFVGIIVDTAGDTNLANNASPNPVSITVTAPAAALSSTPKAMMETEDTEIQADQERPAHTKKLMPVDGDSGR